MYPNTWWCEVCKECAQVIYCEVSELQATSTPKDKLPWKCVKCETNVIILKEYTNE